MKFTRRALLGGVAAGVTFGPAIAASSAGQWPAHPVRLISTYAAGGSSDISLRILAEYFEGKLGKKFFVENRPGAGSTIANQAVARADPDGYTFLYAAAPYETAEAMFGKLSYDPHKDLRPIAMAMIVPLFLIVNANAPYKTLQEFIAYAKSKPDGVTFATPTPGSQPHLAAELLIRTAGIKGVAVQSGVMHRRISSFWPGVSTQPPPRSRQPCPTSRAARCACSDVFPMCAARSIRRPQPCASRAKMLSPSAGMVLWRLRPPLIRSSTRCNPKSVRPSRTQRQSRSWPCRASTCTICQARSSGSSSTAKPRSRSKIIREAGIEQAVGGRRQGTSELPQSPSFRWHTAPIRLPLGSIRKAA